LSSRRSPGTTGLRNLISSMPMKNASLSLASGLERKSAQATCAIDSTIKTPGIIACSGKWPWKYGSLPDTHLMPTADLSGSVIVTLSIKRNGKRCGMAFFKASKSRTVGGIRDLRQKCFREFLHKINVVAVARPHGFHVPLQTPAEQKEVAQEVERLVAGEFV